MEALEERTRAAGGACGGAGGPPPRRSAPVPPRPEGPGVGAPRPKAAPRGPERVAPLSRRRHVRRGAGRSASRAAPPLRSGRAGGPARRPSAGVGGWAGGAGRDRVSARDRRLARLDRRGGAHGDGRAGVAGAARLRRAPVRAPRPHGGGAGRHGGRHRRPVRDADRRHAALRPRPCAARPARRDRGRRRRHRARRPLARAGHRRAGHRRRPARAGARRRAPHAGHDRAPVRRRLLGRRRAALATLELARVRDVLHHRSAVARLRSSPTPPPLRPRCWSPAPSACSTWPPRRASRSA